ncbi:MAG: gas vesicle protein GvpN [Candidatus Micrarchaeota archaeon]
MIYKIEHPRLSRGASVTKTKKERDKDYALKSKIKDELIQQMGGDGAFILDEEKLEAKFLAPKSKNFILTKSVEEYEDRAFLWLKAGYPIHIIGPTGCGKTALAVHIAEKLKKPVVWINGDEELTTHELIGGYSRIEMKSLRDKYIHNVYKTKDIIEPQWVHNPLALACQRGYTLIYNEFSRSKAEANNVLLSILEEGILELPTKFGEERYIKVHPEFNLILTSNNIDYAGVHKPQDALLDRIPAIHMDYYDEATEIQIAKAHSEISDKDAKKIVSIIRLLRKNLEGPEKPGTRPAIMIAKGIKLMNGINKNSFEQLCLDAIASKSRDARDLEKKSVLIAQAIKKVAGDGF